MGGNANRLTSVGALALIASVLGTFRVNPAAALSLGDVVKVIVAPQVLVAEKVAPGPTKKAEDRIGAAAGTAGNAAVDVVKDAGMISIAPLAAHGEALNAALQGQNLQTVGDAYAKQLKNVEGATAQALHSTAAAGLAVQRVQTESETDLAAAVLGDAGVTIVNGVNVPNRLAITLGLSATDYAALVLEGKDPAMLLALPLATALRHAVEVYKGDAKPIPPNVAVMLKRHYPSELVQSARYAIGKVDFSLPSGVQVFAKDNAVSLPGIIVFPRQPEDAITDLHWWAHEMRHIQQYRELSGAEGFAWAYVKHYSAIEDDANNHADIVLALNRVNTQLVEQLLVYTSRTDANAFVSCQPRSRTSLIQSAFKNGAAACWVDNFTVGGGGAVPPRVTYLPGKDGTFCGRTALSFATVVRQEGWSCDALAPKATTQRPAGS
jgi:hypothetical protein